MSSNLAKRAKLFATTAHAAVNQTRKYTGDPYIVHPIEVAQIVATVPHTEEMIAAAYLHDVLEDTKITEATLREHFGDKVTDLVVGLTHASGGLKASRAERKRIDRDFLAKQSAEVQTIKLADLISNTHSIVKHDPDFATTYLAEKEDLLSVMKKGDKTLWNKANDILIKGLATLKDRKK